MAMIKDSSAGAWVGGSYIINNNISVRQFRRSKPHIAKSLCLVAVLRGFDMVLHVRQYGYGTAGAQTAPVRRHWGIDMAGAQTAPVRKRRGYGKAGVGTTPLRHGQQK